MDNALFLAPFHLPHLPNQLHALDWLWGKPAQQCYKWDSPVAYEGLFLDLPCLRTA